MGIAKVAGVTAAVAIAAGGAWYVTHPPSSSSGGRAGAPQAVAAAPAGLSPAPSGGLAPLPPTPAGYKVEVSDHESPMSKFSLDRGAFTAESVDVWSAAGCAWKCSPSRMVTVGALPKTKKDIKVQPPSRTVDREEFDAVVKTEIQRAFGVRVHTEKRMTDVVVVTAPKGLPAAIRPSGAQTSPSMTGGLSMTTVTHQSLKSLMGSLELEVGKPVIDETGLTGLYDYEWPRSQLRKTAVETMGFVLTDDRREIDIQVIEPDPTAQK